MVLELFLINTEYVSFFDPIDFITLSLVSKEIREIIIKNLSRAQQSDIKHHKELDSKSATAISTTIPCTFCNNYEAKQADACYNCFYKNYICKTQAKTKYKLKNRDLELINNISIWISKYYTMANYFRLNDVKRLAILTHKSLSLSTNNLSKAYLDRLAKLNNLYTKLGVNESDISNDKYAYIIFPYKKKGTGGIKAVTKGMLLWDSFDADCMQHITYKEYLYENEIKQMHISYSIGVLDQQLAIDELQGIAYRRQKLFKEIRREGINVSSDFLDYINVCYEYVQNGIFSISEAINEVRIELFFKDILGFENKNILHRSDIDLEETNMSVINLECIINEEIINTKMEKLKKWILENSYNELPKYIQDWYQDIMNV